VHIYLPVLCLVKRTDILLSPEYNTPLFTTCKRAVIAHDAHIRIQKQYNSSFWFYCYYIPFIEPAIRKADIVFTVSEFAKKQIVETMRLDEQKVFVVYNGVDTGFTNGSVNAGSLKKYGLKDKEYILFTGTFETRKNIERLIKAFAILKDNYKNEVNKFKLAVVGKPAAGMFSDRSKEITSLISKLNLDNDVILCGYVPDNELQDIYKGAYVIAFPSLYEGFGLPVIEGFASGVPVLTSNVCSMPEIAGGAAMLVDPYSVEDIMQKLELLIFDLGLREKLINSGNSRVKIFTWEACAQQMLSDIRLSLF
jgi:glycosyltransferase involved in cell wall biosynthesis